MRESEQHFNATNRNIVERNTLRAFAHPVAKCCDTLRVENRKSKACAQVQFSTCNMSQHLAAGWPNACNMLGPTMLRSVALKCCDRLAGACKCWANIVGICCVEMLPGLEPTTANMSQHVAALLSRVVKRTQHVAPNHDAICCVQMLQSFGRGFTK